MRRILYLELKANYINEAMEDSRPRLSSSGNMLLCEVELAAVLRYGSPPKGGFGQPLSAWKRTGFPCCAGFLPDSPRCNDDKHYIFPHYMEPLVREGVQGTTKLYKCIRPMSPRLVSKGAIKRPTAVHDMTARPPRN
jgi:hypothetical protein